MLVLSVVWLNHPVVYNFNTLFAPITQKDLVTCDTLRNWLPVHTRWLVQWWLVLVLIHCLPCTVPAQWLLEVRICLKILHRTNFICPSSYNYNNRRTELSSNPSCLLCSRMDLLGKLLLRAGTHSTGEPRGLLANAALSCGAPYRMTWWLVVANHTQECTGTQVTQLPVHMHTLHAARHETQFPVCAYVH